MWLDETMTALAKSGSSMEHEGNAALVRLGHGEGLARLANVRDDDSFLVRSRDVLALVVNARVRAEGLAVLAAEMARFHARHRDGAGIDRAIALANTMEHPFHRALAVLDLAVICASVGDHRAAKQSLGVANEWIYTITEEHQRSQALSRITEGLAEVGALTARPDMVVVANNISHQIANLEQRARGLAAVGSAWAELGDNAAVQESLNRGVGCLAHIKDPYEMVLAMGDVATLHARATSRMDRSSLPEEAVLLVRKAEEVVERIPDSFGRCSALDFLATQLLGLGAVREGRRLAGAALDHALEVRDPYLRGRAFAQVAVPMAQLEELHRAKLLIESAKGLAEDLQEEYFRAMLTKQLLSDLPKLVPTKQTVVAFVARMDELLERTRSMGADIHEAHSALRHAKEELGRGEVERAGDLAVKVNQLVEDLTGIRTTIPKLPDSEPQAEGAS